MIIDIRFRTPYKGFLNLHVFSKNPARRPSLDGVALPPSLAEKKVSLTLKKMESAGITKALVIGRRTGPPFFNVPNEDVLSFAKEYPGKFFAVPALEPTDRGAALEELDQWCARSEVKAIHLEPGWATRPMYVDDPTMKMHGLGRASVVAFAAFTLASGTVMAQEVYPAKRIRIVVPYPAGGGADTIIRIISSKLSENLRQPILIDNRPGATGNIGTEVVAKAAPDGYTLFGAYSSLASNAAVYTNLPFDTVKDFAPITLLAAVPGLLVSNVSMPVKTVKEVIALAKKRPGEIMYGVSPGAGSPNHLAMELFNMMAGIKMTHVPYKGGPQSLVALIQGEVQLDMPSVFLILPHVKSGKVRPIAVASLERSRLLPNIPTIDESGVRGYEMNIWYALLAPAKTPQPIIEQLHGEVVKVLQRADTRESLLLQGVDPIGSTPEQLRALLNAEIGKWTKVVKATGVKID